MVGFVNEIRGGLDDRIQWLAIIIIVCFVSVLLLSSQSAASYPTYLLCFVMLLFFPQWKDVFKLGLLRWIALLIAWLCLSTLWADPLNGRASVSVGIRGLLVFCFVVALAECELRGQLEKWMGVALTVVGVAAVLAALVNFVITDPDDGRLSGMGQLDTHVVAAWVYGVVLLFVLQMSLTSRSRAVKTLGFCVVSLIAVAVILSDSRNAWVAVALGVLALVASHKVGDVRQFVVAVATGAVIFGTCILVALATDGGRELMLPRGLSYRPTIWSATLERIFDSNPWIGLGITTPDLITRDGLTFQHPHNMYLAVLFQGGLIALSLYVVVLVKSIGVLLEHFEKSSAKFAIAVLVLALPAHLLDGHELIDKVGDTWFLIWMPIGISLGLRWQRPR